MIRLDVPKGISCLSKGTWLKFSAVLTKTQQMSRLKYCVFKIMAKSLPYYLNKEKKMSKLMNAKEYKLKRQNND